MRRELLAFVCMFLIVSMPLVSSAEVVEEEYEESETGAAIAVNVKSYEPTILTANLLEDNDVNVYAFLAGSTLGTFFGLESGIEPLYGGIEIEKVKVRPSTIETEDFLAGEAKYYRPNKITPETLGYLVIPLEQLDPSTLETCASDTECDSGYQCDLVCIPKQMNLSFSAEIWFTQAERLYSLSQTALVLPLDPDEDEWAESLEQRGAMYSFFGGRGLIRVRDISSDSVDVTVYSNKDLYWPIIGAPRAIADVTLTKGKQSDYIDLGYTDELTLQSAKFRMTLTDLKDPAEERAIVAVTIGGRRSQLVVTEGSALYPGSSWTVQEIYTGRGKTGNEYAIKVKDKKGNVETITTSESGGLSEEESTLLNKVFYDDAEKRSLSTDESANALFYDSTTKVINAQSISALDDLIKEYKRGDTNSPVIIDISEVEDNPTMMNKARIESGSTLKELLITLLPTGYYYSIKDANTLEIHKFSDEDPCVGTDTFNDGGLPMSFDPLDSDLLLNSLCTAIYEYRSVVDTYDDETDPSGASLVDFAFEEMGDAYQKIASIASLSDEEQKAALQYALTSYEALIERDGNRSKSTDVQSVYQQLQQQVVGQTTYGSTSLDDNGKFVYVQLISVEQLSAEDLSSAEISKEGVTSTYYVGSKLFNEDITDSYGEYNWYVYKVDDDEVTFKKTYTGTPSSIKATTKYESIGLDKSDEIEGFVFKVRGVNTKKEAHITVTPGAGGSLRSVSNFSIHIPIEKRGIKLNPDKIDDKIAKAKAVQEQLEKIITTMDKILRYWNYVCLGVFAAVSLKSSFASASATARRDAVHGYDDTSGWHAWCQEQSGRGEQYKSYDACMQANAQAIQDDINKAQDAREYAQGLGGNYQNEAWYNSLTSGYQGHLTECQEILGDEVFLSETDLQEYAYLYALQQEGPSSNLEESVNTGLDSYVGPDSEDQLAKQEACVTMVDALQKHEAAGEFKDLTGKALEDKQKQVASGVFESTFLNATVKDADKPASKTFPALNEDIFGTGKITTVGKVFKGKSQSTATIYTESKTIDVEPLTLNVYEDLLLALNKSFANDPAKATELSKVNKDLGKIYSFNAQERETPITSTSGATYYITKDPLKGVSYTIYVGTPAYSTGVVNERYADGATFEVYGTGEYKGLPYCLPYKEGNFIKIIQYTKTNEVDIMQYWNVGADGELCTEDDVLLQHQSELAYNTASPSLNTLTTFANTYIRKSYVEGEHIKIGTHDFTVSYGKSRAVLEGATGSCYDVLDPGDCKLLFNTCDPVMCPPSRFNLGGRYQVDNVVESGLIGSLVLGSQTGDALPVCLTGILASLNYWNSMLEGYVECLEAAKYEGETVGICDKVRSVFWCETAVREAASIMGYAKGGLLDFLATKAYTVDDSGGGEYFQFKENLQNVQNSVTFFTTEYATTAFGAFKGRSTEEIGTEICKQAIYGQAPWFQDFMSQVTTPEDPNQFYATLTAKPYAPSLGQEAYQTYYHIYAGKNANIPNIVYSVYLKNSQTSEVYYVTEECGGVSATMELGDQTDVTTDCITVEGMDTVCVVINGETQCGFGTVSTAFALDFVKDSLIVGDVKRQIDSEEECYPSVPTASTGLSSVGKTDLSVPLPFEFGLLENGVQRVCSVDNPGKGQGGSGDWVIVGTCGEDEDGRSLGSCWLNGDSYTIKDAERSAETSEYLKEVNLANTKELLGLTEEELLDDEESRERYNELRGDKDKIDITEADVLAKKPLYTSENCPTATYNTLTIQFRELYDVTLDFDTAAAAQVQIADIYTQFVEDCAIKGRKRIDYAAEVNGKAVNPSDTIDVDEGEGTFVVTISNVPDTYIVDKKDFDNCESTSVDTDYVTITCTKSIDVDNARDFEATYSISIKDSDGNEIGPSFRFSGKGAAPAFATSEEACSFCKDEGYFSGCSFDDCHDNAKDCYLETTAFDECFACGDIYTEHKDDIDDAGSDAEDLKKVYVDMCEELSDDEERCTESACYNKFLKDKGISGKCYYNSNDNKCTFLPSGATTTAEEGATEAERLSPEGTIDELAKKEWSYWDGADECDPEVASQLDAYYTSGECEEYADCRDLPWSAAFISYLVKHAGFYFPFSCQHTYYFTTVRDNPSVYDCETFRIDSIAEIDVGDILCKCRDEGCPFEYDDEYAEQEGHCDAVVERSGETLKLIGGNLGDTVKLETTTISTIEGDDDYFGWMHCFLATTSQTTSIDELSVVLQAGERPCLDEDEIQQILEDENSPLEPYAADILEYSEEYGIKPEIFLAFVNKESEYATTGVGSKAYNPGNIRQSSRTTNPWYCEKTYTSSRSGTFCDYEEWSVGIEAWFQLISGLYVDSYDTDTVDEILYKYCPPSDCGGEAGTRQYIDQISEFVQSYGCPA